MNTDWIKENALFILWIVVLLFLVNKVANIADSIDRLAIEMKRVSYSIGQDRVFFMEEAQERIRQEKVDKAIYDATRCIMMRREGETIEQFLKRTEGCPEINSK